MRRFFIAPEQIHEAHPRLGEEDARHVRTVLRLQPGTAIVVFDGTGAEYEARIDAVEERQVCIALVRPLASGSESPLEITLAQAYLKDKKMDQLVRRLTELGVTRWLPFMAKRSIPSPDEKRGQARHQRWQKISQEAVKQCRRSRPMRIETPVGFAEALEISRPCDLKLFFWEGPEAQPLHRPAEHPLPAKVFVMIGPEGGFDPAEQHVAQTHGFRMVAMGPRILRAETATVAACTLVQFLFGDMGQNVLDKA
jgi:16S rRNA (uracil1498-N3)-methyltransferase